MVSAKRSRCRSDRFGELRSEAGARRTVVGLNLFASHAVGAGKAVVAVDAAYAGSGREADVEAKRAPELTRIVWTAAGIVRPHAFLGAEAILAGRKHAVRQRCAGTGRAARGVDRSLRVGLDPDFVIGVGG